jgi:hypothetical protein
MDINWKAPFEFAFELAMFMVGAILVLAIVFVSVLIVFGLIKGFFGAIKRARGTGQPKSEKPNLRTVKDKE